MNLIHRKNGTKDVPEGIIGALGISHPLRFILFVACVWISILLVLFVPAFDPLSPAQKRALFILILAALLWVTEAIAAYSVGILIIALNIALLGDAEDRIFAVTDRDWIEFVTVIGNPLIWLFFGGFVLAEGMSRTGLDRWLASRVLSRFGARPSIVLLGVMTITFVLSMFVSNTATAAMMVAMLGPLITRLHPRFATGVLLGTAVAANLGGMGSLIGTPPNAIAVGVLSQLSDPVDISFLQWMLIGLPVGAVLMLICWAIIARLYPSPRTELPDLDWSRDSDSKTADAPPWQVIIVALTLVLTVGLWMTSQWHNTPTAVVSFLPIVMFTTTGILSSHQIRGLNYDVLFLLAGGLALGQVVTATGLSDWIVSHIPTDGMSVIAIAALVSLVTLGLSNFMSNTAAANVVIPLSVTMAVGAEARVAVPIALAASAAMCLPIATPPNAMIFATGKCGTRDFLRMGLIVGLLAPVLSVGWSNLVLGWLGH